MLTRRSVGRTLSARRIATAGLTTIVALTATTMTALPRTNTQFTGDFPVAADLAAGRIFRDERVTPAFYVQDVSSGVAVDGSSGDAFAGDGRYFLTRPWPMAFDGARYVEFDLNNPLPAGLGASNVAVALRLSGDAGTGSACIYGELRRASNGAVLASGGSPASPIGCTSGSSALVISLPLGALVPTTDVANDLRLRLYGRDSDGGALRIDQTSVSGETPYSTFTLYPVLTREAYDGQIELIRWSLAGP